ncbi:glycosyltransferase [Candidatus Saccharibacteria bacterium]|nr:glycosyltransferase [Candidatus Saccharibacteria bacterium]
MKKILLIRNAYAFDFGGGERLPVDIAAELQKYGHKALIVSRSPKLLEYALMKNIPTVKGLWWRRQDWSGKNIILVPIYLIWQILLFFWYCQLIIRSSPDIVHPQSRDDFIGATLSAKLLRKKVVWSDYADLKYIYQNNQIWYKNPVGKVVLFLSRFAEIVILTSKSDKKLIEESLGEPAPSNHLVIHMGVSSIQISKAKRQDVDKTAVIFGATSRLVTTKGIAELIHAFNSTSSKLPNVRLWLFGEGPDEEQFKRLAENNKHIVFWGYPEDTMERLASCDVFVHPSYHEGFSISLVEAAKLGLPIIACAVGGNPELVKDGENGLLIEAKDSGVLAGAMEKLATNKSLREEYGKNARKTYESSLVFEKIVRDKFVPLYEK